jgi:hypothetical protein
MKTEPRKTLLITLEVSVTASLAKDLLDRRYSIRTLVRELTSALRNEFSFTQPDAVALSMKVEKSKETA